MTKEEAKKKYGADRIFSFSEIFLGRIIYWDNSGEVQVEGKIKTTTLLDANTQFHVLLDNLDKVEVNDYLENKTYHVV